MPEVEVDAEVDAEVDSEVEVDAEIDAEVEVDFGLRIWGHASILLVIPRTYAQFRAVGGEVPSAPYSARRRG